MQPRTVRLPHSGLTVPHDGYTVTAYKELTTHDGVAFTATLRLNRKIIGTIENEGVGDDRAVPVRVIEAVDIDDLTYLHTRLPGEPDGNTTIHTANPADDSDPVAVLCGLARDLRTS